MEHYIKTDVNDITYVSELIPAALLYKAAGINSQTALRPTTYVTYVP
jgi:hypothetical protein